MGMNRKGIPIKATIGVELDLRLGSNVLLGSMVSGRFMSHAY